MDWLRTIGTDGRFGIPAAWLPFVGFLALLIVLFAAELSMPLRLDPQEGRGRLLANFGLGIVNALILSALPFSAILAAEWAHAHRVGLLNLISVPQSILIVATFAIWSLAVYAIHVLSHRVPLLWRIHRIHHCDTAVDLSTGVRHHPLEPLYVAIILTGPAALLGVDPAAIAAYAAINAGFALWSHANMRLPDGLDRALRLLLVTPAVHNVHHSSRQAETDSNYGDVFTIWDRLFGTYRTVPHSGLVEMRVGLGQAHDPGSGNIWVQLRLPLEPAARG
jgi:sterol desaturase/sphingolipid hydroxylase (fatty acid hydroxylase superfamily)